MEHPDAEINPQAEPVDKLEEAVARKLYAIARLDPGSKFSPANSSHGDSDRPLGQASRPGGSELIGLTYYPVHSLHRDMPHPLWQEFRPAAREIIALVQAAGKVPA